MTTIFAADNADQGTPTAGTHVLIIGVGWYPCLLGGDPKQLAKNPLGLGQLTSPPASATALADWFLAPLRAAATGVGFYNPEAPLQSVELLVSPESTYDTVDRGAVTIEPPLRLNIDGCYENWLARAQRHPQNIAVFYFCGHGVSGSSDYLLASDFGSSANPWTKAFDMEITTRAARRAIAGSTYFFVDSCRKAEKDALLPGAAPQPLQVVDLNQPVQGNSRLVLWATGEGEKAFGARDKVSRFTAALLQSLSGYCGEPDPGRKTWMVTGEILASSVQRILARDNTPNKRDKRQHVEQRLIGSTAFHYETHEPSISYGQPSTWSVPPDLRISIQKLLGEQNLPADVADVLGARLEANLHRRTEKLEQEVRDWAERYKDMESRLSTNLESPLAQQAAALLKKGRLDEAGEVCDRMLDDAEKAIDRQTEHLAYMRIDRAHLFTLQGRPQEALQCYQKAYQLAPANADCSLLYGAALFAQARSKEAERVFATAVEQLRSRPPEDAKGRRQLAIALNDLSVIYRQTARYSQAEALNVESIALWNGLIAADPELSGFLAGALVDLGSIYALTARPGEAMRAFTAAIKLFDELQSAYGMAFRFETSVALHNLGGLCLTEGENDRAEWAYTKALALRRELAQVNKNRLLAVADTLGHLGAAFRNTKKTEPAKSAFVEALEILRLLDPRNTQVPTRLATARTLTNYANLRVDLNESNAAIQNYEEAIGIYQGLQDQSGPEVSELAQTLYNLGIECNRAKRIDEARRAFGEALKLFKHLNEISGGAHAKYVDMTQKRLAAIVVARLIEKKG